MTVSAGYKMPARIGRGVRDRSINPAWMFEDPCGSEPAHESGVSADYIQTEKKLSRAGSLPQGLVTYPFFQFVARNHNPL